ncbi:MAG TPA: UDP-N-acetylmuramoyl-L-alanyl-D-glutamate--2,6-diaminopimelate ligase, partial [Burkholderiales bacterium]|nr:UDP-N-acetylmuramoyl-L-alanyl-D-glutamate--2,6-diaminopimelate ligase [Burkholderiales bacterium]
MRIESSVHAVGTIDRRAIDALDIRRLTSDSRTVRAGDAFAAYPGENRDGRDYIAQAIAAGASTVLWESADFKWKDAWRAEHLGVRGLRHKIGPIASHLYGRPSSRLWMVGVTGTNGKTSCSQWIAQAFNHLGRRCAVAGTLGNGFPEALEAGSNTTPDAAWLHGKLRGWYGEGARAVAMEVSSHGLEQGRVAGVEFDVAMFTNLTRDHLDYHGSMSHYRRAKAQLFGWDTLKWSLFNLDDRYGAALARMARSTQKPGVNVLGFGFERPAARGSLPDVQGRNLRMGLDGISFDAVTPWGSLHVKSAVLGRFNASNLLGTLTVLLASESGLRETERVLGALRPVPGRAQSFGGGALPLVVVDYAHTPDALEKMLLTLREILVQSKRSGRLQSARLICVFGCGGERDRGKRAMMGRIATQRADEVIVTSDNPRGEDPLQIIAEILQGTTRHGNVSTVIEARTRAVDEAIATARPGDIVLIAGKGHEPYQEIKGVR